MKKGQRQVSQGKQRSEKLFRKALALVIEVFVLSAETVNYLRLGDASCAVTHLWKDVCL